MKTEYVVRDRHGYLEAVWAETPDEAVRAASNLSEEADLEFASYSFESEADNMSADEFEYRNCSVAMDHGNNCYCGHH